MVFYIVCREEEEEEVRLGGGIENIAPHIDSENICCQSGTFCTHSIEQSLGYGECVLSVVKQLVVLSRYIGEKPNTC